MAPQTNVELMPLSGSTDGRMIKIAATSTPGTLLHTATAVAGQLDEVWLYFVNSDTTARKLTIEKGGTSSPDDTIEVTIPPESGLSLALPGLPMRNGLVIRAFAASGNVLLADGFVKRWS